MGKGLLSSATLCVAATLVVAAAVQPAAGQGANKFPNVTLTTQHGTQVRFYDDLLKGKSVAINLIYTTCQYACPLETARLAQVQRLLGDRMGRDVFFYSITIDPEHDTPAVLKAYSEKYHAGPGWLFLTGKQADIDLISKKLGLYSPPAVSAPDNHKPFLLVGNEATGQWMRQSAVDNPAFLATTIGDWLSSWQNTRRESLKSYAEMPAHRSFDRGQYTFSTHCAACHTIGRGDHLGPDLLGVTTNRDHSWLTRFIMAPDKMNAQGDATAVALRKKFKEVRMPNLDLSQGDVTTVLDYIARESRAVRAAAGSSSPPATPGASTTVAPDLKSIVDPYLRIHESLSADSLQRIEVEARRLASSVARLGSKGASINAAANQVMMAVDLKSARVAFGDLGEAILRYAKETKAGLGSGVNVAYCPMARKYWLQTGQTIRNPFYGKEMASCGRISAVTPSFTK